MNVVRSEDQIYEVLFAAFEKIDRPLSCTELLEMPDVRAAAINRWGKDIRNTSEKLSDTLGFLWRRGTLDRFTAPPLANSRARWAYAMKDRFVDYDTPKVYKKPEKTKTPGDLEIVEKDGEVVITMKGFVITVRPRK